MPTLEQSVASRRVIRQLRLLGRRMLDRQLASRSGAAEAEPGALARALLHLIKGSNCSE